MAQPTARVDVAPVEHIYPAPAPLTAADAAMSGMATSEV